MDNRSQFYIISAVILCVGLLIISSYLVLDIKHVQGVSFEADNIQRLYEDVIAISITQDPTLKNDTLRDNLNETGDLLDCIFYSRGYDIRTDCNMTDPDDVTSMFIHAEVKNITMIVTRIDATQSSVEIINSGFGGDFRGNLSIDGSSNFTWIQENSSNITVENPNATATLLDLYNYTLFDNVSLNSNSTRHAVYINITGTILNPVGQLKIEYSNGTSPVPLINGIGYPGNTSVVFTVNQSQQVSFTEIVNTTYNKTEPIIWITNQTDLESGRINATNAINIDMAAPMPINTNATACFASISLYMSSCDTSVYKEFNIIKKYFN